MSKIGKKLIIVPAGVDIKIEGQTVNVKGPKGELSRNFNDNISIGLNGNEVSVLPKSKDDQAIWGLWRSILNNMVLGVTNGFEKVLEFQGVGYKATVKGADLELSLGYSHPILYKAPQGISFNVEKNVIRISGSDKELVGRVASQIREKRKPEPYKGSGIRYQNEVIKKKAGKKAITAG